MNRDDHTSFENLLHCVILLCPTRYLTDKSKCTNKALLSASESVFQGKITTCWTCGGGRSNGFTCPLTRRSVFLCVFCQENMFITKREALKILTAVDDNGFRRKETAAKRILLSASMLKRSNPTVSPSKIYWKSSVQRLAKRA
jgi:hypothetical protein